MTCITCLIIPVGLCCSVLLGFTLLLFYLLCLNVTALLHSLLGIETLCRSVVFHPIADISFQLDITPNIFPWFTTPVSLRQMQHGAWEINFLEVLWITLVKSCQWKTSLHVLHVAKLKKDESEREISHVVTNYRFLNRMCSTCESPADEISSVSVMCLNFLAL